MPVFQVPQDEAQKNMVLSVLHGLHEAQTLRQACSIRRAAQPPLGRQQPHWAEETVGRSREPSRVLPVTPGCPAAAVTG